MNNFYGDNQAQDYVSDGLTPLNSILDNSYSSGLQAIHKESKQQLLLSTSLPTISFDNEGVTDSELRSSDSSNKYKSVSLEETILERRGFQPLRGITADDPLHPSATFITGSYGAATPGVEIKRSLNVNNTSLPTISLTVSPGSITENGTAKLVYTFTRTGSLTGSLTINYGITGAAINGTDYAKIADKVTFAPGSARASVNVTPIDDILADGNETLIITLSPGGGYTVGTANKASATIIDNEPPLPSITVKTTDATAGETKTGQTANLGVFTLTRTGNLTSPLTVNYALTGTGIKGTDYNNLTGKVTFAVGSATAVVNITPIDDILFEGNETAILTLVTGQGYGLGANKTGSVTIIDNDSVPNNSQKLLQGLSSTANIFTSLDNVFSQNSLLLKNLDLLGKRIDVNTAKTFLLDAKTSLNQVLVNLNKLSNPDLKTIVTQLSGAIKNIGTVTVSIDGQVVPSGLIANVNLKPDSEVIFNFNLSKLFTIAETIGGNKTFSIAGTDANANITGQAKGSASLGFKFDLGIDKSGKTFVSEGGLLNALVDLNSTLTGTASLKGLANGSISGTGKLNLNTLLKIDDGDTIVNERLYLSNGSFGTLFAPKGISFTGGINLTSATVKVTIANLGNFEIPVAATGSLNFVTGKAELVIQQDAVLDALVNAAEKGIGSLANQSRKVAQFVKSLRLIGNDLSNKLTAIITQGLTFDAPNTGTRAYLASRNITIETLITPQQFFTGNFLASDALLLRYNPSVSQVLQLANISESINAGLAKFTLSGNLQPTPNLAFDFRFGLDLKNGPFMMEGGSINAALPVKGNINGTASIGKLLSGQINIPNINFNTTAKLSFTDSDAVANEKFYLLGSNNALALDTILSNSNAISLSANLATDAAINVANPFEKIDIPFLKKISFGAFSWNANLQYNLVTGQANYTLKNDSAVNNIISLLQGKQQNIINGFLENLIEFNPIPKDVRKILTQQIPLLGTNLMEIIGIPKRLQLLIAPEAFNGRNIQQINDKNGQQGLDILNFSLDLLKTDSILKLLSGQDSINLISLDIKQTFDLLDKSFTVLPNTTVFTFYGIVGVSAGVKIKTTLKMLLDTIVGYDTDSFYVVESGAQLGAFRKVGETLFSINPKIGAALTGTLDLITVIPLIDITGIVSLAGAMGLKLDDEVLGVDSNPKVRWQNLTLNNLRTSFKLDLEFDLTSDLFPIDGLRMPLIKEGEVHKTVPLYEKIGGSLADISSDVKSFVNKTRNEGGLKVFAVGVITSEPSILTAGTALMVTSPSVTDAFKELATGLKESGRDMLGAARELANIISAYGLNLGETAKFLFHNFSGGIFGVATAIWSEGLAKNSFELAKVLWSDVGAGLVDIAGILKTVANRSLGGIVADLVKGAGLSYWQAAFALWNGGVGLTGSFELAKVVWNEGAGLVDIAGALKSGQIANRSLGGIVADLVKGAGLSYWQAGYALWNGGFGINSDTLVRVLRNEGAGFDTLVDILQGVVGFKFEIAWATVKSLVG